MLATLREAVQAAERVLASPERYGRERMERRILAGASLCHAMLCIVTVVRTTAQTLS